MWPKLDIDLSSQIICFCITTIVPNPRVAISTSYLLQDSLIYSSTLDGLSSRIISLARCAKSDKEVAYCNKNNRQG